MNRDLVIGISLLAVLLFFALIGPHLPFVDTEFADGRMRFLEDGTFERAPFPPSEKDLLGTDREGRDILSLIILGIKETLYFMFAVTLLKYVLSIPLGFMARKGKGVFYSFLSTWGSVMSGLPILIMGIILFKTNLFSMLDNRFFLIVLSVSLLEIGRVGMVFQQLSHKVSTEPYIEAALTIGTKPLGLFKNHYIPALVPEILVNFMLDLGRMALLIGQLGVFQVYLHFKVELMADIPIVNNSFNLGSLLGGTKNEVIRAPWIPLFPALAITYIIFTFNMLGSGIRKKIINQ
ncbi:ABC transporter permease subunit [Fredinandcohnia sp. 179-A 10B2 NHS]|uniref:ABC transporter permease subunit n=1 Tax=Fredinandcohnia sp. 179-A 10B2 NHS TaxID=3235176 RepID=UPI00399F6036